MASIAIVLSALGTVLVFGEDEHRTLEIRHNSYAAIAYSPATGKYAYSFDCRSRASAEKMALEKCEGDDARIVCWVSFGFCALALGDDKSCWGVGWKYGNGAGNREADDQALAECQKRTTGAHSTVILSSDGQYIWDRKDHFHTTIIDAHGNVTRDGEPVTPSPQESTQESNGSTRSRARSSPARP